MFSTRVSVIKLKRSINLLPSIAKQILLTEMRREKNLSQDDIAIILELSRGFIG